MPVHIKYVFIVTLSFLSATTSAQFTEIASQMGIEIIQNGTEYGNGLSFYDFNQDGWDDLTIANDIQPIQFYINNQGNFELASITLNYQPVGHVVMILWGDIDNDGDSDLLTTELEGEVHLWQNDGAFDFTDITTQAGLPEGSWRFRGAAFADYDHDGFLDLYLSKYYTILNNNEEQYKSKLFHNNGNAIFEDVTVAAGVDLATSPNFQPVFFDFDHDGWEDLYLVIDRNFFMNRLFRNNHDGTFTDVSIESGANPAIDAMSGTVGDYDNDGDLDVFVANGWPGNHLYENNANGTFSNIAANAGVMVQMICWGSLWLDYDNDSWRDLYIGTTGSFFGAAQSRFFVNNRNDTFSPGEETTGINDHISAVMNAAMGDLNHDGYYDFVTNSNDPFPSEVWLNDGGNNHYLAVSLEGVNSNKDGVGAWINCYAGDQHLVEFTRAGDSFNSQSSSSYIFGLDTVAFVDSLIIEWNSGHIDAFYHIPADQHILVVEGMSSNIELNTLQNDTIYLCLGDSLLLDAGQFGGYNWSTGDTTQSIVVIQPGEYYVVVQGLFSGWVESGHIAVLAAPSLQVSEHVNNPTCHSGNDGAIYISVDDQPYTVFWQEASLEAPSLHDLPAGSYHYTIWDIYGCSYEWETLLDDPDEPLINTVIVNSNCAAAPNGAIEVSLPADDIASILWNDGSILSGRFGLSEGIYTYSGLSQYGCPFSGEVQIDEPDEIIAEFEVQPPLCFGENSGHCAVITTGGLGSITINWNGNNQDSLFSGVYGVVLSDSVGCQVLQEFEVPAVQPLQYTIETSPYYQSGTGGQATISVTGGTGQFAYDPPSDVNGYYSDLNPGPHQISVTDSNNCELLVTFYIDFIQSVEHATSSSQFHITHYGILCFKEIRKEISLYDLQGKLMVAIKNTNCIDISGMPQGVYLLSSSDLSGENLLTKIVK
jgi:hypothetical protein